MEVIYKIRFTNRKTSCNLKMSKTRIRFETKHKKWEDGRMGHGLEGVAIEMGSAARAVSSVPGTKY
jgi:hypothetical protein